MIVIGHTIKPTKFMADTSDPDRMVQIGADESGGRVIYITNGPGRRASFGLTAESYAKLFNLMLSDFAQVG